jgi:hypothetical protein
MSDRCHFERVFPGCYRVSLTAPSLFLGLASGESGSWRAQTPEGKVLSSYNTRADAARALKNHAKLEGRLS